MAYFHNGASQAKENLELQCSGCLHSREGAGLCPIFMTQVSYNHEQPDNAVLREALSVLIDDNGDCQMRSRIERLLAYEKGKIKKTLDFS